MRDADAGADEEPGRDRAFKLADPLLPEEYALPPRLAPLVRLAGIHVGLTNVGLWKRFKELPTEMILTRQGRCLFPQPLVQLSGMVPSDLYEVSLEFVAVSSVRWRWSTNKWVENGRIKDCCGGAPREYVHPDSPRRGDAWMASTVNFNKCKVTNIAHSEPSVVQLNSFQQYVLRVHVIRVDGTGMAIASTAQLLTDTTFIAVTVYQNDLVRELKKRTNPHSSVRHVDSGSEEANDDDREAAPKRSPTRHRWTDVQGARASAAEGNAAGGRAVRKRRNTGGVAKVEGQVAPSGSFRAVGQIFPMLVAEPPGAVLGESTPSERAPEPVSEHLDSWLARAIEQQPTLARMPLSHIQLAGTAAAVQEAHGLMSRPADAAQMPPSNDLSWQEDSGIMTRSRLARSESVYFMTPFGDAGGMGLLSSGSSQYGVPLRALRSGSSRVFANGLAPSLSKRSMASSYRTSTYFARSPSMTSVDSRLWDAMTAANDAAAPMASPNHSRSAAPQPPLGEQQQLRQPEAPEHDDT